MGNRERIVTATIALMNKYGSSVGTTQLADHLKISPGNLYYHFRNRDEILDEVLTRLIDDLENTLYIEPSKTVSEEQLAEYFSGGADVLWHYRFFFSASLELIINDDQLRDRYRKFIENGIKAVAEIIKSVVHTAPSELKLSVPDRQFIAENMWVMWTSWPRFSEVLSGREPAKEDIDSGLEHIAMLLKPYVEERYFKKMLKILRHKDKTIR